MEPRDLTIQGAFRYIFAERAMCTTVRDETRLRAIKGQRVCLSACPFNDNQPVDSFDQANNTCNCDHKKAAFNAHYSKPMEVVEYTPHA